MPTSFVISAPPLAVRSQMASMRSFGSSSVIGNAGDRGVPRQRHHRVAVPAEDERVDVLDRHVELLGDERAHARRVEHAGHADDALAGKPAQLVDGLRHRVERIGDDDDDAVGRVLHDVGRDVLHDLVVDLQEIVAAHARLARHARRDDDDVRVGAQRVVAAADERACPTLRSGHACRMSSATPAAFCRRCR